MLAYCNYYSLALKKCIFRHMILLFVVPFVRLRKGVKEVRLRLCD